MGSMAAAHTQHPLPGEEAIPSHPVSLAPPTFLSLTSHPAAPFPVCFHMGGLDKEAKGKYVCGADVKLMTCAMTILVASHFIPSSPLPTRGKGAGSCVHCTGISALGPSLSWLLCSMVMKSINNTSKGGFAQKEEASMGRPW